MESILINIHPALLALGAGFFTWGMTAAGAAAVFFFKEINKNVLNIMLGFAAGIMVAAAFWGLLLPAMEMAQTSNPLPFPSWVTVIAGFAIGGLFLLLADHIVPHMHPKENHPEGISTSLKRSILLVLAVTLHNIPEGLAFGVLFGVATLDPSMLTGAIMLAIGIGIQNIPEGAAVSIPLRKEGFSRKKSFLYGQASGVVEPVAAVIGAWFAASVQFLLPAALGFAAGAMIYVVVEELIPEAQSNKHSHGATHGFMVGFMLMTVLDIALG